MTTTITMRVPKIPGTFDRRWETLHSTREWGTIPNEHFVRFLKRGVVPYFVPSVALDIGCGGGAQTLFLRTSGYLVDALDAAPSALTRLSDNHCACQYILADIASWRGEKDRYAVIADVCTLQHLSFDDARTVIERARTWLKPGGWFFSITASHEFDMECEIQPRLTKYVDLHKLFSEQWKMAIGHENVLRPQGGTVAHWIIEAQNIS